MFNRATQSIWYDKGMETANLKWCVIMLVTVVVDALTEAALAIEIDCFPFVFRFMDLVSCDLVSYRIFRLGSSHFMLRFFFVLTEMFFRSRLN